MGNRGNFKYICDECNTENWLSARERTSRFKPRCIECGSLWLNPSKKSIGPKKISQWNHFKDKQRDLIDKKMGK